MGEDLGSKGSQLSEQVFDAASGIPGAGKAVSKIVGRVGTLVTSSIDPLIARGEQKTQGIRDVTALKSSEAQSIAAAKAKLRDGAVQAMIGHMNSNPDLAQRAIEHLSDQAIDHQVNREAVMTLSLEDLRQTPPSETPKGEPTDDWLNLFSSYAERATSETLRQHWAHILAGEIRKPGSFSFVTLHLMSIMDQRIAEVVRKVLPYVLDGELIPNIFPPRITDAHALPFTPDDILLLEGAGFVGGTGGFVKTLEPGEKVTLHEKSGLTLVFPQQTTLGGFFVTLAGQELMTAILNDTGLEIATFIADSLEKNGHSGVKVLGAAGEQLWPPRSEPQSIHQVVSSST